MSEESVGQAEAVAEPEKWQCHLVGRERDGEIFCRPQNKWVAEGICRKSCPWRCCYACRYPQSNGVVYCRVKAKEIPLADCLPGCPSRKKFKDEQIGPNGRLVGASCVSDPEGRGPELKARPESGGGARAKVTPDGRVSIANTPTVGLTPLPPGHRAASDFARRMRTKEEREEPARSGREGRPQMPDEDDVLGPVEGLESNGEQASGDTPEAAVAEVPASGATTPATTSKSKRLNWLVGAVAVGLPSAKPDETVASWTLRMWEGEQHEWVTEQVRAHLPGASDLTQQQVCAAVVRARQAAESTGAKSRPAKKAPAKPAPATEPKPVPPSEPIEPATEPAEAPVPPPEPLEPPVEPAPDDRGPGHPLRDLSPAGSSDGDSVAILARVGEELGPGGRSMAILAGAAGAATRVVLYLAEVGAQAVLRPPISLRE